MKLKKIRCDNGGEFINDEFTTYLRAEGIELDTSAPKSSAQNGIAERVCRTVMERTRTVMIAARMPKFLWPEAVAHVIYLKNRLPTRALKDKTPDEVWTGQKPDVSNLQEWGTRCWVLTSPEQRTKLDPKSKPMYFMGVADGSKAWRYYDPVARRVGKSRNVIFAVPKRAVQQDEDDYEYIELPSQPLEGESGSTQAVGGSTESNSGAEAPGGGRMTQTDQRNGERAVNGGSGEAQPPRDEGPKPREKRKAAARINYKALHETGEKIPHEESYVLCLLTLHGTESVSEPRNFKEAQQQPEWSEWWAAMKVEYAQLCKLGTFELVELPPGRRPIGCRWVYRLKRDEIGLIMKYKARLVAQGFSQVPGLDFFETFAPVVRLDSLRILLAIIAERKMVARQYDVVGAYLNAPVEEEIYMRQPPGFDDESGRVLRLRKALYGLKQGGRMWNQHFNTTMVEKLGFRRLAADLCVYIKVVRGEMIIFGLHVDDMLGGADTTELMDSFEKQLRQHYDITSLGKPRLLLGLEVAIDEQLSTITIKQKHFILTALERYGMSDCAPVTTPMDPNVKLTKEPEDADLSEMKDIPYQGAVGTLLYLALGTRGDIAFAVQAVSQFCTRPGPAHWTAIKRIFRYLKGSLDYGITYGRKGEPSTRMYYDNFRLEGYSDADWASNPVDRRSISGYVFMIGSGLVAWSSKKQAVVALSSTEAEYMAVSYAARHAIWMRTLLSELSFEQKQAMCLNADNMSAIALSKDNVQHARSKHIDIRHHFIRECIETGTIVLKYVPTADNVADLFTKALPRERFHYLRKQLGILSDDELRGSVGV